MPIKADKSLRAYYNEIDPFAAQWIRNLMAEGWITKGDVDDRSIEDVQPNDIAGYDRLHFFAGVAVWDYALNQAGWGRGEIWTGSCPCQPFSAAGAGAGFADERHLWPAFHHLIEQCRPATVLGEQVASKDANPWIDLVQTDLEALDYRVGAIAFPASSVGAPHIRDRLYWVADAGSTGRTEQRRGWVEPARPTAHSVAGGLADAQRERVCPCQRGKDACAPRSLQGADGERQRLRLDAGELCGACGLAHPGDSARQPGEPRAIERGLPQGACEDAAVRPGPTNGFWRDADWLGCRDGKWRPVEPGTFPLVTGAAARVVRLRAYGNSITAPAATAFIESVMDAKAYARPAGASKQEMKGRA